MLCKSTPKKRGGPSSYLITSTNLPSVKIATCIPTCSNPQKNLPTLPEFPGFGSPKPPFCCCLCFPKWCTRNTFGGISQVCSWRNGWGFWVGCWTTDFTIWFPKIYQKCRHVVAFSLGFLSNMSIDDVIGEQLMCFWGALEMDDNIAKGKSCTGAGVNRGSQTTCM